MHFVELEAQGHVSLLRVVRDRFGLRLSATRRHVIGPPRPPGDCRWATVVSTTCVPSPISSAAWRRSRSYPTTSRPATSRPRSPRSPSASRAASRTSCSSAPPAPARPRPSRGWPSRSSGRCWCMQPNKTLAAQFANELRQLFPDNAIEYFVSYYDYYQPEAYVPQTDTYIEKDSSINEEVERLRHSATNSLLTRRDVIVVAHRVVHLRPRHPAGVRRPDAPAQGRRGARPRRHPAPAGRDPVHPQRHDASPAATSGSAATPSRSSRSTRSTRSASSSSATRSSG